MENFLLWDLYAKCSKKHNHLLFVSLSLITKIEKLLKIPLLVGLFYLFIFLGGDYFKIEMYMCWSGENIWHIKFVNAIFLSMYGKNHYNIVK